MLHHCGITKKTYLKQESVYYEQENSPKTTDSDMIIELLKQNQEFKQLMIEQSKNSRATTRKPRITETIDRSRKSKWIPH